MEKEIDDAIKTENQQNLEASGFQLVTRRTKKKNQKTNTNPVRNNYKTRSRPSNQTPSQ